MSLPLDISPLFTITTVPSANWFSDLRLTRAGLFVRKTGRRIGLAEITPSEMAGFLAVFAAVSVAGLMRRIARPRGLTVRFEPDRPRPWYVIWSALTVAGIAIADEDDEVDAVFQFEDTPLAQAVGTGVLNGDCPDITKSHVARAFERASGYPLMIDPTRHEGEAVEKGEGNGVHDGSVVRCPCVPRPGHTYQRFVDAAEGGVAIDLRTTIIGRRPVCVLVKTKPASDRFSIHNDTVCYHALEEVFSPAEIALLTRFAQDMALDWAALDVLRDAGDGRIYVVDVNKTDAGPAVDLSWRDKVRLLLTLSRALTTLVRQAPQGCAADMGPARPGP